MFVMQNKFINNDGNLHLQTKSVKDIGARGFRKPNSFLVHRDKFVLQRAPIFNFKNHNMQNSERANQTGSARNARIIQSVNNSPLLQGICQQVAESTRIGQLVLQIQGAGIKIKCYTKTGIVNAYAPTLEEALVLFYQKIQLKNNAV